MKPDLHEIDNQGLLIHLRELVQKQKECEIEILLCLREVMQRRLELRAGFPNIAEYCQEAFGMSTDVAWKKARAARIIGPYPELFELLKSGKTHMTHVAMVANQITQANSKKICEFLPGASKRDLQFFLDRLMPDGSFRESEPMIEVKFRVRREVLEKLDHAAGLLAKTGPGAVRNRDRVLEAALDALIERRDPVKKAKRAADRVRKKSEISRQSEGSGAGTNELGHTAGASGTGTSEMSRLPNASGSGTTGAESYSKASGAGTTGLGNLSKVSGAGTTAVDSRTRPAIAATVKHQVYLRDKGRCTFVSTGGRRCSERSLLHIDHIKPWSLGGDNSAQNLRTLCAHHNNLQAEVVLGQEFMQDKLLRPCS